MVRAKLKIRTNIYPSDKQLSDLILAQKVAKKRLEEFLRSKGVLASYKKRSDLVEVICSLVLGHDDIEQIVAWANVRESRIKTSVLELSAEGVSAEDILDLLQKIKLPEAPNDNRVKLPEFAQLPTYDKETNVIQFEQPFKRIDFGRTALMQEEDHQFGYSIQEQAPGSFKIVYSTSDASSEVFFSHIKTNLERALKCEKNVVSHIHEIRADELADEKWNHFFSKLIDHVNLGMSLLGGKSAHFIKGDPASSAEDVVEDGEVAEQLLGDEDDSSATGTARIKKVTFEGKDIFSIREFTEYKERGFSLRSIVADFRRVHSPTSTVRIRASFGFNPYGKFACEIQKAWLLTNEPGAKEQNWTFPNKEREGILEKVNGAAFEVFDELLDRSKSSN
ncbi:MAG: hypothetical protein H7301_01580 [Cryobacterium sp.]|nr:hypothetical protein [Oligoflexia bacterium]